MAFGVTDLKKGTIFQLEDVPYRVVEYSQKVMGRGGSIVNVKIKSLIDGKVFDRTFKGNDSIEPAQVSSASAQYLYSDHSAHYFMDENFETHKVALHTVGDQAGYLKEGDQVQVQSFDSRIINIEMPRNVYLEVSHTEDAVKGDTSSAITKEATLETGIVVKVPAFIKTGDKISVDTTTGNYRERAKS